jgi:enoyl-CoA hydratase
MTERRFVRTARDGPVATLTLDRPKVLNAWHTAMREEVVDCLRMFEADPAVGAIVVTGAGERAFCAGQDLNEAKDFDPDQAVAWIGQWKTLYGTVRGLSKPLVAALNGVAAGSAFQFVLLADIRIAHDGVTLGQPEIRSGIASILGPWIMREVMGLSRTVELTLTGRLMGAHEAHEIGIVHHLVPREAVLATAQRIAAELAALPAVAMHLDKAWLREMTEPGFEAAFEAALRYHRRSYESGEPQRMSAAFVDRKRKG